MAMFARFYDINEHRVVAINVDCIETITINGQGVGESASCSLWLDYHPDVPHRIEVEGTLEQVMAVIDGRPPRDWLRRCACGRTSKGYDECSDRSPEAVEICTCCDVCRKICAEG